MTGFVFCMKYNCLKFKSSWIHHSLFLFDGSCPYICKLLRPSEARMPMDNLLKSDVEEEVGGAWERRSYLRNFEGRVKTRSQRFSMSGSTEVQFSSGRNTVSINWCATLQSIPEICGPPSLCLWRCWATIQPSRHQTSCIILVQHCMMFHATLYSVRSHVCLP
jgi:hypothetical protein